MSEHDWIKEFPAAVTVCDENGIILGMNDRAARTFEKDGGYALLGKSMLDCHSDVSRGKVQDMLASHERNVYSIEKNGVKNPLACPQHRGSTQTHPSCREATRRYHRSHHR